MLVSLGCCEYKSRSNEDYGVRINWLLIDNIALSLNQNDAP
jgi:hypothetical protein